MSDRDRARSNAEWIADGLLSELQHSASPELRAELARTLAEPKPGIVRLPGLRDLSPPVRDEFLNAMTHAAGDLLEGGTRP